MKVLHRDSLPRGGFAGLRETRLVVDNKVGQTAVTEDLSGLGNFIYLADARYLPHGETRIHGHKEIDIITVLLEGRLNHEGSLEHGQSLIAPQVQVQRAGGEGFSHNEINPDETRTRLLQIWLLPEESGLPADYKLYDLPANKMTRIYGGHKSQTQTFDNSTTVEIGILNKGKNVKHIGKYIAYIVNGEAVLNGEAVKDGDLIRGTDLNLTVTSKKLHLSLFYVQNEKTAT